MKQIEFKFHLLIQYRDHPHPSEHYDNCVYRRSIVLSILKRPFNFTTVLVFFNRYKMILDGRLRTRDRIERLWAQGSRRSKGRGRDDYGLGTNTQYPL